MHELGIVFHIIESVEGIAAENDVKGVSKVVLELGEVSGVIPSYLLDCWKWAIKRTEIMKDAELVIEETPAQSYCRTCEAFYETVAHGRTCPECGSGDTYLVTGNEMTIRTIEVIDED